MKIQDEVDTNSYQKKTNDHFLRKILLDMFYTSCTK